MENRLPRVAITQGDTNGVGYEMIFKALEDPTMLELMTPIIYGSQALADQHIKLLGLDVRYNVATTPDDIADGLINLMATGCEEAPVEPGKATETSGTAGLQAIDRALADYELGVFDVLVTAPLDNNAAFQFSGQGRYIEDHLGGDGHGFSLLVSDRLRIALATRHLPLRQVMEAITKEHVEETAKALARCLRRDFRISGPRLAVLALNPKAGDNGQLGTEEQEMLTPAIQSLLEGEVMAFGPYATDTFFGQDDWQQFDGILAMYYDQALTPFRSLAGGEGCCYTAGLDLVHTSPVVSSALDKAGQGTIDPASLRQAIFLAIDIMRNREEFDAPLANPLKKLYKEKRDDGDRSRFNGPKKKAPKDDKKDKPEEKQ